jgi:signal transduction histidine kinase
VSPSEQTEREVVRPTTEGLDREHPEYVFLRGLIDGLRCGVLTIDAEGRLVLLNDHARRILELPQTPPLGLPLWQALPRHPQLVRVLLESFRMSSLPNRAEMELGRGPRAGKRVGFTLSLVSGKDGEPCGAAMFFKDLTPIEHKEEQERLKDRLAALGQMAASMAHEIRNPLASIEVSCKLLERRSGGDPACQQLLAKVRADVQRLNGTVDSCLRYVRPVTPSFAPAELVPLLEEAIRVARGRRDRPGVEIRRRFAPDIPAFLMDRELLRQVFDNLILNALESVGDTGRVTVEAGRIDAPGAASIPYRPPDSVGDPWGEVQHLAVVRVSDTGPGIPEEDQDHIFHPFFTTKKHGSGVGLAVAKKIVGSHHGMIDVTSAAGEGASIRVRLPMVERASEEQSS